jgi:GNAT superfamily N-acetyltransferase
MIGMERGNVVIRAAGPADEAVFRALWQGFQDHYDMELPGEVTDSTWARLMDPACPMQLRLAEVGGAVRGFLLYQHHPSSWVVGDDCYLEDLFVDPGARGLGLGRALIADVMALAKAAGWHRIYWLTEMENATARRLYDSVAEWDGHIRYRRTL